MSHGVAVAMKIINDLRILTSLLDSPSQNKSRVVHLIDRYRCSLASDYGAELAEQ